MLHSRTADELTCAEDVQSGIYKTTTTKFTVVTTYTYADVYLSHTHTRARTHTWNHINSWTVVKLSIYLLQ